MVDSTASTGALLLLLLQLHLPTTVVGGCTETDNTWKASKDCKSYYWCSWGVVGQFYDCVQSELFDEVTNACVNPARSNFECPGLNWREDDPEGAELIDHTTSTTGSLVNPLKMYCSTEYIGQFWTGECGEQACPSGLDGECPEGQHCYMMTNCQEALVVETVETPPPAPAVDIVEEGGVGNHTEQDDIEAMIATIDFGNPGNWYCSELWNPPEYEGPCGYPCPNTSDEACPSGQKCFANQANCKDVGLTFMAWRTDLVNLTMALAALPTKEPTTQAPTPPKVLNPNLNFCKHSVEGECGKPCPGGFSTECEDGQFCFTNQAECKEAEREKAEKAATYWCGKSFDDMANRCPKACPNGTDEECDSGDICFSDSVCATEGSLFEQAAKKAAAENKLWCASSYKDLVENCPMKCPGGTSEECGDGMTCFNMSEEEASCSEEGVGIKAKVDSANLWCGESWIHMLENCPKACPEGTDEECGTGMTCFDMSTADKVCEQVGYPVKEKDDPEKRFCGKTFQSMHESCPKKCPSGSSDDCPNGMQCFGHSECKVEGVGVVAVKESDPSMMYCGSKFEDAAKCSTPCPSGGTGGECPSGQTCFAEVTCGSVQTVQTTISNPLEEEAVEVTPVEEEAVEVTPVEEEAVEVTPVEEEAVEVIPVEEEAVESVVQTVQDTDVDETTPTSSNNAETAESEAQPSQSEEVNAIQPAPQDTTPDSTLIVENLELILYGMTELTSVHVYSFEKMTETYLEMFYNIDSSTNDAVRDSVTNFDTSVYVLKVESPNRGNLRSRRRLASEGYRVIYSQKISYDADLTISVEDVIEYPFSTSERRYDYIEYLKAQEPRLFSSLSVVSAVILTDDLFVNDSTSSEAHTSSVDKFKGFKCHNTGVDCPSGECNDGDVCMFFAPNSDAASSQQEPIQELAADASTILDSVLKNEAIDNGHVSADSSTRHNVTDVYGKIVIHGTNLVLAEHLKDWESFTSSYLQNFYNNAQGSMDYVQNNVNNVQAKIEMESVEFGTAEVKTTTINFKIPISWETRDDSISFKAIVSQPFFTKEYRQSYIEHMKSYLPGTFSLVTDVSGVIVESQSDVTTSAYEVSNTFFCGDQWPVDCSNATRCNHANDCPSSQGCFVSSGCLAGEPEVVVEPKVVVEPEVEPEPEVDATIDESTTEDHSAESSEKTPCSLCPLDQVLSSYIEVTFNGKAFKCGDAYDFVSELEEGSPTCVSAKEVLARDCCVALNEKTNTAATPVEIIDKPQPAVVNTIDTTEGSTDSDTYSAAIMNDQWNFDPTKPASEGSNPQQKNAKYDWLGGWESAKMKSSSCTISISVSSATVLSLIVLEMILA
ncbi:hypothetical protein ACHAXM_008913 [Skeletonema potamos]